jgi:hypothetical protein
VVLFTDSFDDPGSGWFTKKLPSGTSFGYAHGSYVVVAKGTLHHYAYAPYDNPADQLRMSMTATQSRGAPAGSGFGLTCVRGLGRAEVSYEFVIFKVAGNAARWIVERRVGEATPKISPTPLRIGSSVAVPGPVPMTVGAVCATSSDHKTTRVELYVNGRLLIGLRNRAASLPGAGWDAGLTVLSNAAATSTVVATSFEARTTT